jgi:hypothetical protein
MTMLEIYKAIQLRCEELRDDKSYPAALVDCGYLSAAAVLIRTGDMSEEEAAEADEFDRQLREKRLMRALEASASSSHDPIASAMGEKQEEPTTRTYRCHWCKHESTVTATTEAQPSPETPAATTVRDGD